MIRRDSPLWWWCIAASILTALSTRLELIHRAFPQMGDSMATWIELAAFVVGIVSGVMRASPLPISDRGRAAAITRRDREILERNSTS